MTIASLTAGDEITRLSQEQRDELVSFLDRHLQAEHCKGTECYSASWDSNSHLLRCVVYHLNENGKRHYLGSPLTGGPQRPIGPAAVIVTVDCDETPPWVTWSVRDDSS